MGSILSSMNGGGMDVLDLVSGYDRAILVDAIKTGQMEPGSLVLVPWDEIPPTRRLSGLHDLDLPSAMELADRLGMERPRELVVLGVEIEDDMEFDEHCTPRVEAAVDLAARAVLSMAR
ncbi:MAG: hydrogenase maturation protease [Deltaproteobacteria bacterium]|nr:hydrogenase maturation protease [Deltaproteobacteria bacterium]